MIDITFKTYSDAGGGDPDATSKTLKAYHKFLWSKELPSGRVLDLRDDLTNSYLYHESEHGVFYLGSDAITHSYRNHKDEKKRDLIKQVQLEANELFEIGSTIGAYLLFPNKQINRQPTINQARGVNAFIDDRFDLTLECIRRHYLRIPSPLSSALTRYQPFFELFGNFKGYVDFFFLNDLLDKNDRIKFYLPFDEFNSKPRFNSKEDYRIYKEGVSAFVTGRNARILAFASQ